MKVVYRLDFLGDISVKGFGTGSSMIYCRNDAG